jgi:hypothetical protein
MGPGFNHTRERLTELRNGLMRLHKTLLDSERAVYERDVARIGSRGQLLGLVMHDPWFDWLHELSELVVAIDETLAEEETARTTADHLLTQARFLLMPAEEGAGFARRYFEAMQRDPDVVLAHGATMRLLATLD